MIDVVITGGSGFVAGALRARLEEFPERYRVRAVSLRDAAWRREGFAGCDCVVHTAGIAHVTESPSMAEDYFRVNRDLTLETARRARADGVKQFIFLSSAIVYGDAAPAGVRRVIGPDTPVQPSGAYGRSKLEAEQGLRTLEGEGFRVAVVRPPMVYGKGCKGNYNALSAMARKLPAFPRFENRRSVLYVENLAECLRLLIDGGAGGLYFPQDARVVSTAQIVAQIARARGRRIALLRGLNPLVRLLGRRGMARRAFGDLVYDPAMSTLPEGYRRFDFESSIRRTEIE